MKTIIWCTMLLFFSHSIFGQAANRYARNELVVKFNATAEYDFKHCLFTKKFNNKVLDSLNKVYKVRDIKLTGNKKKADTYVLRFKTDVAIDKLVPLYFQTGLFDFVEPNFTGSGGGQQGAAQDFPNDTYFARQWGLFNDGSFSLAMAIADADVDMELAWDIEQGSPDVVVAILDSGARLNHPEFAGRIWQNVNENADNSDTDNNGYTDDTQGWDFVNDDQNPTDDLGHGTNVAGIVGANANNNAGYAGVDRHCQLMICKILDDENFGYYTWWTDAIYYAVDNGADVINMSVGGSSYSNNLANAVSYAYNNGVPVIVSMMNEDSDQVFYPAGYSSTIAVGSTDPDDERSSPFTWDDNAGSSFGEHIDVVAPGHYIYGLSYTSNTSYGSYWSGTSQAAPLVTGVVALLLAQHPGRTPDEIKTILRETAEDQVGKSTEDTPGFDIYHGYGRVNAHQALLEFIVDTEAPIADSGIPVYPNPSSGLLNIEGHFPITKISIIDMTGSAVHQQFTTKYSPARIDLGHLPAGVYFMNCYGEQDRLISSEKVLLRR